MMKQKAAMKVTEDGTELSSVTNGVYAHGAMKPHADFHANRPFVYVIQEASSGAIFFIGTFMGE
jgi:serpin B